MPTVVDLASPGSEAFALYGDESNPNAGHSVSGAGDVNGDGLDDVIIATAGGSAYVVFGRAAGLDDINLENLKPDEGFRINAGFDQYVLHGSGAGDVNGDGFDDVIVGGSFYYGWYGSFDQGWVIFGGDDERDVVNLYGLNPTTGFGIWGQNTDSGLSVGAAGDINGDGFDDLILGAPSENGGDGAAYILFGKSSGFNFTNLFDLTAADGFKIVGKAGLKDYVGLSVSGAGDVNGDGYDDIIIGAPYAASDAGEAYVIFGKPTGFGTINLSTLPESAGFVIQGATGGDYAGFSVSGAGDVNGDGYDDILIGVPDADNNHELAGEAYVIFGKASGIGTINLANLAASAGFAIYGDDTADHAGFSVSAAGDVNNDGYDDIVIGAPENDNLRDGVRTIDAGEAYVIYGRANGFSTIDLTNLSSSEGFVIQGAAAYDRAAFSVAGAGDVDGDGFGDLIVGAPYNDHGGNNAGAAYVVSGKLGFALDVRNDFNGDGRSDVLWRNTGNGTVTEWLGLANGGFFGNGANAYINVTASWHIVGTGDFNGDDRDDVLWRNDNGTVTDWLGQANGSFFGNGANAYINVDNSWHIAGTGDFNGDGRDDVLWRNDNGTVTDWVGQANGSFFSNGANAYINVDNSWHIAGTGDFNGDGRDDVLWRNDNGTVTEWLGQANGGFFGNGANAYINVPNVWHIAGTGDFNGDGRDDVLWRNDNGTVTEWLGQANGGFVDNGVNAYINVPASWHIAGTGDYNGDGRDDVLWRNDNGTVTEWLSQANGGFVDNGANAYINVDTGWQIQDPYL